jgi:hypothetical protein
MRGPMRRVSRDCRLAWAARVLVAVCLFSSGAIWTGRSAAGGPGRSRATQSSINLRLAVDVVKLRSGKTLRGTIAHSGPDGSLTMAVARDWLQKADPKLLAKLEADETRVERAALEQLRDRIKNELGATPEDLPVAALLRVERTRVDALLATGAAAEKTRPSEPQFVWVDLAKKEVDRVSSPSVEHKRVAGWAWYERLANVETRPADDLASELKRRGIDVSQPVPDLSERLPIRLQDDREWSARMALLTYSLGKPLDFQGTGDLLVRSDRTNNAGDMAPLVAKLFGGQVDSLLKDLLSDGRPPVTSSKSPTAWLESAIREAERDKARAFRATRVDLAVEHRQASVTSVFVVELNGKWEIIWSERDTEDGSQERPQAEAAIANDPQVKSSLALGKSLGTGADDQVRSAIRFGAATMAAQQTVNRRFSAFQEPYLRRLDGPPLRWTH